MRKTMLAFLSVVVASVVACKHGRPCDMSGLDVSQLNACQSQDPPIVCIDPQTLNPSRNPVHIHSGQYAHFFLTTGHGELTITCEPGTPVDYVGHAGGHAWVHALPVKTAKEYKYTINVDGRIKDPEMVIEP